MPCRQNSDISPSEATLKLFCLLLFSGKEYSLSELANVMECSRQSIGRMMDKIDASGKGVVHSTKRDGQRWYRLKMPQGSRPHVYLEPHELERMALCRDLIGHLLPVSLHEDLIATDAKAATLLQNYEEREKVLQRKGHSAVKGHIDYSDSEAVLRILCEAMDKGVVCSVRYHAPNRPEPNDYDFLPSRIVGYREALYVRGWKITEKGKPEILAPRLFAIHRMVSVSPTRRSFSPKELANLPPLEETGYFGLITGTPFRVVARFSQASATYVKERNWGAEQSVAPCNADRIEVSFIAQSEVEVVKWILGFGCDAEIVEPAHLRKQVSDELDAARAQYSI